MGGKKAQAITRPLIGMVILEDDPRGSLAKQIYLVDSRYVYCRAGSDGSGRRTRVLRQRLREGRYKLIKDVP